MTSSFLIPIGVDLGRVLRADRPDRAVPQLRAQRMSVALSEAEHRAWRAAHVPTELPRDTTWTRADAVTVLTEQGEADPAALLDSLTDLGLVAEITPHTDANTAFATTVRLVPRTTGLAAEDLGGHTVISVGPDDDPLDAIPAFLFDLFIFGAVHCTVADAISHTVRRAEHTGEVSIQVLERSLLEAFLFYAPGMISRGAVALDQVGVDDD